MRSFIAGALLLLAAQAASGQTLLKAGFVQPGCIGQMKAPSEGTRTTPPEAYLSGFCAGAVSLAHSISSNLDPSRRSCPPSGSTVGQSIEAVVKYIEANPARKDEPFANIVLLAFRQAWPCP